ncbi:MAG TPA: hypothetical protein VGQ83_28355 [Polyangia bacterium]
MRTRTFLLVLLLAVGCSRNNPAYLGPADAALPPDAPPAPQQDAASPQDAAAADDAGPPADASPAACAEGESTCVGGLLADCDAAGTWIPRDPPCDSLCTIDSAAPPRAAHCGGFEPANGLPTCGTVTGHGPFLPSSSVPILVIDTDLGTINGDSSSYPSYIQTQTGGPDIRVFKFSRIEIPEGVEIVAVGHAALALYAETDVVIAGAVRAGPGTHGTLGDEVRRRPPAGAWVTGANWPGTAGIAGAGADVYGSTGGGGGGFGQNGGAAGSGPTLPPTAGGGAAYGTADLVPLLGGSPGGTLPITGSEPVAPAGGGALQIVGCRSLRIAATGRISASGQGGPGGLPGLAPHAGQGGGSGGAVLLESPSIIIAGRVTAHGGGGGGGASGNDPGGRGEDGREDASPARGGAAATGAGGGGAGGIEPSLPSAPEGQPGGLDLGGGGGGGGLGRLRLNVAPGAAPDVVAGAVVTPLAAASKGELVTW